jgi:hypothetical protein
MALDIQGDSPLLNEWNTARGILKDTDEHLHDLRKYGFTFVTALLTAESFLIPSKSPDPISGTILPPEIKIAVLGVTLVLIIALQLMDRYYQVLQDAAATRALVLERALNLELTEVITLRFNRYHVKRYAIAIYGLFVFGVVVLGWAVLFPIWYLMAILLVVAFATWGSVFRLVSLKYPYGAGDWTIDRLECSPGEEIRITLTNLCPPDDNKHHPDFRPRSEKAGIWFPPNQVLWKLLKEDSMKEIVSINTGKTKFILKGGDSHVWLWKVPEEIFDTATGRKMPTEEGIYQLYRAIPVYRYDVLELFSKKLARLGRQTWLWLIRQQTKEGNQTSDAVTVEEYGVRELLKMKLKLMNTQEIRETGEYELHPLPRKLRIKKKNASTC